MPAERGRQMGQRIGGDTLLEREGGGNLQNSKEYFRNRITTTLSSTGKVGQAAATFLILARCCKDIFAVVHYRHEIKD